MKTVTRLGLMLNAYRRMWNIPAERLANNIRISVPTLYRLEAGKPPDAKTLRKLYTWFFSESSFANVKQGIGAEF